MQGGLPLAGGRCASGWPSPQYARRSSRERNVTAEAGYCWAGLGRCTLPRLVNQGCGGRAGAYDSLRLALGWPALRYPTWWSRAEARAPMMGRARRLPQLMLGQRA